MRKHYLLVLSLIFILTACTRCSSPGPVDKPEEKTVTVEYKSSNDLFPNPERGFYKYSDCNLGKGSNGLTQSKIEGYRKDHSITLLFRYFYLKDFKNSPLSAKALEDFDNDMETIRKAGAKCIVRFAYSSAADEADAPLSIISEHLDQLKPYLQKNVDVIAFLQAGFIGAWGEWYYTSNGLNTSGARHQVISKLLEALPANRYVQLRTPAYKTEFLQRKTAVTKDEAFSDQAVARLGHHNDCFLASANDYGTYENIEADKAYLNRDCLYLPIGGETCPPSGIEPADGLKAYSEMRYLRWTYLNDDYYNGVNNLWKANGYMDIIKRELGYRFQLISGEYTSEAAPGNKFYTRIILKNIGFGSLYNERAVELVLKNKETKDIYKVRLEDDPRFWRPEAESSIDVNIALPSDIPSGEYKLYLSLPDMAETIYENPDYSVRFANENVWEAESGYNDLQHTLYVDESIEKNAYTGNLLFKKSN